MHSLNFTNKLKIEAKGLAGSLRLIWKFGFRIDLVDYNKGLIAIMPLILYATGILWVSTAILIQAKEGKHGEISRLY